MDPFLIEALVNGILLGGVFALPVLGCNLVADGIARRG